MKQALKPIFKVVFTTLLFAHFSLFAQEDDAFLIPSAVINIPRSEQILQLTILEDSLPAVISSYGESLLLRTFTSQNSPNAKPHLVFSNIDHELLGYQVIGSTFQILSKKAEDKASREYSISTVVYQADSLKRGNEIEFNLSKKKFETNNNSLFFKKSLNDSFLLVCQQEAFRQGQKTVINVFVFSQDTTMNFHLPSDFDSDDFELAGASIDNAGTIYFAGKTGIKLNSPFRKKHLIYSFDPFEKVLTEFDLASNDFFIQDMLISSCDSGFAIGLLYSTDPLINSKTNGYSFIRSTKEGKSIGTRLGGTFSEQTRTSQQDSESRDLYISDLFLDKMYDFENQPVIVLEKKYNDQICTADPNTGIMTCTDQYHFNNISFENTKFPEKSTTVERRQIDYDKPSEYTGHSIVKNDDELWLFYNDHFRNEGPVPSKIMNNASRSVVRFAKIDLRGKTISGVLSTDRQNDYIFMPQKGIIRHKNLAHYLTKNGDDYRVISFDFSKLTQ
ncbi:MAG: hypothetical protein WEC59_10340 [Salibacteraceae bacterium]